jgi:hypothetical protein
MSQDYPHANSLLTGMQHPPITDHQLDQDVSSLVESLGRLLGYSEASVSLRVQQHVDAYLAANPPKREVIYVAAPTNLRAEPYTIREGWASVVPMIIGAVLGLIAGISMIFQFKAEAFNVVGPDMQYMLSLAVEKPWFKIATLVITTAIGLAFGMLVALLFGPRTQTGIRLWAVDSDGQERLIPQGIAPTTTHVTNVRI